MTGATLKINTADEILHFIEQLDFEDSLIDSPSFITSYADLIDRRFNDGEEIAFHAMRSELVLVQSVTNRGKSTWVRNAAFALTTGNSFLPIVDAGEPRRVLLLNLEGSGGRFQTDLRLMANYFSSAEMELIRENFFPTHAPMIDDEPLSLSRHMDKLEREARKNHIDVIIIDTVSAGFSIKNENDNAEVANYVMKPLLKLARKLNCVIVLVHHIGKAKSEEGSVKEEAHRGRGASAFSDFSTSIFNLEANGSDEDRVTLTCGKRKDGEKYSERMKLDRAFRRFTILDEAPPEIPLNRQIVRSAITRPMQKKEIVAALGGSGLSERTIERCLSDDIKDGLLIHPNNKRGLYAQADSATSASTYEVGAGGGYSIEEGDLLSGQIKEENDLPF